jgi:hypothetical protein
MENSTSGPAGADTDTMRTPRVLWLLLACATTAAAGSRAAAQAELPPPRELLPAPREVPAEPGPNPPLPPRPPADDCLAPPGPALQELLSRLRSERDALAADVDAAARTLDDAEPGGAERALLALRIKQALGKLTARKAEPKPPPAAPAPEPRKAPAAPVGPSLEAPPRGFPLLPKPAAAPKDGPALAAPVDALALGHNLFRAGNYAAALTAFGSVELKGKKAEDRVPVQ